MKNTLLFFALFLFLNTGFAQKGGNESNALVLQEALDELKKVTDEIATSGMIEGSFDVSIKLNNVVSSESGFELNILFLKFKRSKTQSYDNSFTTKYKFTAKKKNLARPYSFNQNLARAITSGIETYLNANPGDLTKKGFNLTLSFTLSKTLSGEGSGVIVEPITIGASKSRQKKTVHTITIDFKPKEEEAPSKTNELIKETNKLLTETNEILKKNE
jgi:hypothetical protein